MTTCGDVNGGKPCEHLKSATCPSERASAAPTLDGYWQQDEDDACSPMLALVAAREEAARWKSAAERMETAARKWEREPCCAPNADPCAVSRVEAKWIRHGLGPNDDPMFCACDECKAKSPGGEP